MSRPSRAALESHGRVHIYERGERYRVVWVDDYGRQRERVRPTLLAARAIAERQAALLIMPGGATQPDALFGALVADWLAPGRHPQWSRRTRDTHVGDARCYVIPTLGGQRCCDLTGMDFANVLTGMVNAGRSRETISRVLKILRACVKHGRSVGTWPSGIDPMLSVGMPARAPGRHSDERIHPSDIPSVAQVEALARALDAVHPRCGLMIRVVRDTGLRWAELIALRPMDINLTKREINVTRSFVQHSNGPLEEAPPKTRAGNRQVVFSRDLVGPLRARMAELDDLTALMFGTLVTNTGWRRGNWAKLMKDAREESGYPEHLALHSIRHYSLSDWLARGLPLGTVARLAGHSSPEVTLRRYVGAGEDHLDQARAIL